MNEDEKNVHKSNSPSQMRRSSDDVHNLIASFKKFLNPLEIDEGTKDLLFCLSSGKPASGKVMNNLLNFWTTGENAAQAFIESRLIDKSVKFHDPIKKQNFNRFQSMAAKCKVSTTQKKTIQVKAEINLLGRLLMLSQKNDISLQKIFKYPLGPIPWAIATAEGSFVKTDQSKFMHHMEGKAMKPDSPAKEISVYFIDGNAHFQAPGKLPSTYGELCFQFFMSLPSAPVLHFLTDTYKDQSIKEVERSRRDESITYLIGSPNTKLPQDFKSFLYNAENKREFIRLIHIVSEWQSDRYAAFLCGREIFFAWEQNCVGLHSLDGRRVISSPVLQLTSNHEEADTWILLHCLFAAQATSSEKKFIIRSPDTDVFILLFSYAQKIRQNLFFDTGTGNKRRLLDVHGITASIGTELVTASPGFHAFTGSDCTSSFVRKGKITALKALESSLSQSKI